MVFFWVTEFKKFINFLYVWCRDVMTSCHDVTPPDLPISACRCARKLILFCIRVFLGQWIHKCYWFVICIKPSRSWRHGMTSQNLIYLSQLVDVLESWFFFSMVFRSLSSNMLLISHLCDAVTSWSKVMTSQKLFHLSQVVDLLER